MHLGIQALCFANGPSLLSPSGVFPVYVPDTNVKRFDETTPILAVDGFGGPATCGLSCLRLTVPSLDAAWQFWRI